MQKIYSTPDFIVITIRFPGKTKFLWVGRGGEFNGVYLSDKSSPSHLRLKDNYLEYNRVRLRNTLLYDVFADDFERIVIFKMVKRSMLLLWSVFIKGTTVYFCWGKEKNEKIEIKKSWSSEALLISKNYDSSDITCLFNEVGRRSKEMTQKNETYDYISEYIKKNGVDKFTKTLKRKKEKFKIRKMENIKKDIKRMENWKKIQEYAGAILEEDLKDKVSVVIANYKIKIPRHFNFYQKRDHLFLMSKRFRAGREILLKRLEETEALKEEKKVECISKDQFKIRYPIWNRGNKSTTEVIKEIGYTIYKIPNIGSLGLGKNAKGNDQLRKEWGKKEDIWFHLDGMPGAHAILKSDEKTILSKEVLDLISSIISLTSKHTSEEIPLVYTKLKYIRGVKGVPGMVTIKKEKHYIGKFDKKSKVIISPEN